MTANHTFKKIIVAASLLLSGFYANAYSGIWQNINTDQVKTAGTRYLQPDRFTVFSMDVNLLKPELSALSEDPALAHTIELPMPDGSFRSFRIWQTPFMAPQLAAKYPDIKTFTAVAADNGAVTAKVDYTVYGFHAMVYDGDNSYFIDPYSNANDGYYICYYKKDYTKRSSSFVPCGVTDSREDELGTGRIVAGNENPQLAVVNGLTKRTYRLALACTQEYASVVTGGNPTKPGVLSAMTTTMNRINGVYEKELAITMQLIANNDNIIYLAEPDPYSSGSMTENQTNITNTIGAANYDIGHLFKKSDGGISDLGCVCNDNRKARSVTGQSNPVGDPFDLDYVAHEMGHQFGAEHTFNAGTGSCTGNGVSYRAYEPGSGSTLMAYAGICSGNNITNHSSAYFHAASLEQITDFVSIGGSCAATSIANTPAIVPPFATSYNVPKETPFELTAPDAVDNDHDAISYCWEEWDLGDFTSDFSATTVGPIFRSFDPTASKTRIFPTLDKLLNNVNSYLGEKLPTVTRDMVFKLTVRDILNGIGAINFPDDEVVLHVTNSSGPFVVMSPNTSADYWQMGTTVEVKWDVANTTSAPVSCNSVDILLSLDGGHTYTETLASGTANDGSEMIVVPNTPTASARVKVKGSGNVFFDISNKDFIINSWSTGVKEVTAADNVNIYPVPATDVLHVTTVAIDPVDINVLNALGQIVWAGTLAKQVDIPVSGWAKGMYSLQLVDAHTKLKSVKKFIVE
jgi:hypothetical protein